MGISADAKIIFGFYWDADEEESISDRIEALVAREADATGHLSPWGECPVKQSEANAWIAANRERIDARRAAEKAVELSLGVEVVYFGADGYECPVLTVTDERAQIKHWRTGTLTASMLSDVPTDAWEATIRAALERLGIDPPAERCEWHFGSYYG